MSRELLILGGGLAGASVAFWLGRAGLGAKVCLLEQGGAAGAEASAQNAGMLRRFVLDEAERALVCRAAGHLRAPPDEVWDGIPLLRESGGVVALVGPERLAAYRATALALQALGVQVESLDRALPPALAGAALSGAWRVPGDGPVDAQAIVDGFLRAARRDGVAVRLGARVTGLRAERGRITGVELGEEVLSADVVVLAGGAWSGALAAGVGLDRPLRPLARHLFQSAPHPHSSPDHPWCWLDDVGLYLRPEAGGWLCSPCDEALRHPPAGPGSAGPVDPYVRALAQEKLHRHLPAVAGLHLRGGWTGLRTFSPDRRPLLGPDPELPGLWWASGLGGFGLSAAFAVGELVVAQLLGEPRPWVDEAAFAPGRPFRSAEAPAAPAGDPTLG